MFPMTAAAKSPARSGTPRLPAAVDRATWQAELDALRVRVMGNSSGMLDMTVYGRQELWEDSPEGWPRRAGAESLRSGGRPIPQGSRLAAGRSDGLGTGER